MKADRWTVVREILENALDLEPTERIKFVADACGNDTELRSEVDEYLRYEGVSETDFSLGRWISVEAADEVQDPERIGVYRVLRRLGEGGMGVVYLAERDDDEYRQQVAIKALKPGPQSARLLYMFRRERQILAQLQHPNIAHLMDGGTADGQIYFVMEYVDGLPVTMYCRDHKLTVRQRLQLFCRVCEAVSYAHGKLIIHRDLKPGNILVTVDGDPKLLDFGLARMFLDSTGVEPTIQMTGAMLTPAYASPEQVRGEPLGTATDLYSLGVLLYELLTGANPQAPEKMSPIEVCRTILEAEPQAPSHVADHANRRELAGDLDNIVLKAIRKEPEHRYASVDDFRRDIERYIGGFPVHAARGSTYYRTRKYVGRHRWGLGVCVLGSMMAAGAATMIWWQGQQAKMRFNDVRDLAHSVIFELHDAVRDLPGSTSARKLIVERALQYLRKLEAAGGNKRDLQMEMAAAYQKIGEVQSDTSRGSLGDTAGALESFVSARRLLDHLVRTDANDSEAEQMLSNVSQELAEVYELRGDEPARAEAARKAAELQWDLARRHPETPKLKAAALRLSANNLGKLADWKAALPLWQQAAAAYDEAAFQSPNDPEVLERQATSHNGLAQTCNQLGQLTCALEQYEVALRIDSARLAATGPDHTRLAMLVSFRLVDLGWIEHSLGKQRDAVAHEERALALQERIAEADPQNTMARLESAKTLITTGLIQRDGKDLNGAAQSLQKAKAIFESMLELDPSNQSTLFHLAWSSAELGDVIVRGAEAPGQAEARSQLAWKRATAAYERSAQCLALLKLDGKLDGLLDDRSLRAAVPKRLRECRAHLANGHPMAANH